MCGWRVEGACSVLQQGGRAAPTLLDLREDQLLVLLAEGLADHDEEVGAGEWGELRGGGGPRGGRGRVCHPGDWLTVAEVGPRLSWFSENWEERPLAGRPPGAGSRSEEQATAGATNALLLTRPKGPPPRPTTPRPTPPAPRPAPGSCTAAAAGSCPACHH